MGYKQCPALPGEGDARLFSSRCLVSYFLPLPFPTTFAASTDLTQICLGSSGLAQPGRGCLSLASRPLGRGAGHPWVLQPFWQSLWRGVALLQGTVLVADLSGGSGRGDGSRRCSRSGGAPARTGRSCLVAGSNPSIVCAFKLRCDVIGLIITIMLLRTSWDCNLTYGNQRRLD